DAGAAAPRADHGFDALLEPRQEFIELFDRHFVVGISVTDDCACGLLDGFADSPALAASLLVPDGVKRSIRACQLADHFARAVGAIGRDDDLIALRPGLGIADR